MKDDGNKNLKTHGKARQYCKKHGIEVRGNTDVFMIARGLARAFTDGTKYTDFPILRIVDDHIKSGASVEMQDDHVCLVGPKQPGSLACGEIVARGETLKELLENCVFAFC